MSRARARLVLAALLAPALGSCIVALDFDELSAGSGGAAGVSAGKGGSGASGGSAGSDSEAGAGGQAGVVGEAGSSAGGAVECAEDCNDDDPCTADTCVLVDGTPTCDNLYTPGLALDGIDETITADDHHRVTMIGGPDAFFYSIFSEDAGERDLFLYRLGANAAQSQRIATLSTAGLTEAGRAVSAAGLAVDETVGLKLHAFIGVENALLAGARVWHVVLQGSPMEVATQLPVGDSYLSLIPTNYPVAANIADSIYGAWITEAQTIEVAGLGAINTVFSAATQATTLAMFSTSDDEPAVLYTGTGSGVFVESTVGVAQVEECEPATGSYLSAQTVPIGVAGLHLGSWTKAGGAPGSGFLLNENKLVGCAPAGCSADMACESQGQLLRNSAAVTAKLPGDAAGVIHYALATPYLAPGAEPDTIEAGLSLQLVRIEFGSDPLMNQPTSTPIGAPFDLARVPTDDTFVGPDWPAIAYVEPNKIAVAWLQPADSGSGEQLRVQRYEMCVAP